MRRSPVGMFDSDGVVKVYFKSSTDKTLITVVLPYCALNYATNFQLVPSCSIKLKKQFLIVFCFLSTYFSFPSFCVNCKTSLNNFFRPVLCSESKPN
jgi:hypothetical protein